MFRSNRETEEAEDSDRQGDLSILSGSRLVTAVQEWFDRIHVPPSVVALACILVIESILLVSLANQLRLWYDELLTLHYANLRPWTALMDALRSGKDVMTPGFLGIMSAATRMPGDIHINLRLPSIAGYLLTLTGVFLFIRKRLGGACAVAAVLLIALSPFRAYATEARPYAMLTGFLAVAAANWQRLDERRPATPLMWAFFLSSVAMHHFAGLAIGCLIAAETVLAYCERRLRKSVWGLAGASIFLVALQLPMAVQSDAVYSNLVSKGPQLNQLLLTYKYYLGLQLNFATVLLLATSLVLLALMYQQWPRAGVEKKPGSGFTLPELAMAFMLVLYPAMLVAATVIRSSWYGPRYGWPAILGLSVVWAIVFSSIRVRVVSGAVILSMALVFAIQAVEDLRRVTVNPAGLPQKQIIVPPLLEKIAASFPAHEIVVVDGMAFVEMAYYSGHGLNGRLTQLMRSEELIKRRREPVVDKTNRKLSTVTPLRIQEVEGFLAAREEFIVYVTRRPASKWLLPELEDRGYVFQRLSDSGGDAIHLVKRPNSR